MRTTNSIKNFLTTIIPYLVITLLGFFKVRGFVVNLGDEIYSINQVFYQIFTCLSLAECGVGIIILQKYYKLLIDNDYEKINNIYSTSKIFLRIVALVILIIGIVLSFFLKYITNNSLSLTYLQIVFVLFLFRNLIDYLMFSPRFIIQADQNAYKINKWINFFRIIELLIELGLIYSKQNYILILIPSIFTRIIMNIIINKVVFKQYPWLTDNKKYDLSLLKGTGDFIVHKVSNIIYSNTDLLIISILLKPLYVVIYSGYNYIITVTNEVISIFSNSIVPSLANAINKESNQDSYNIFEEQNSLFSVIAMFFSICIIFLIKSFVILWMGDDKILDINSLLLMAFSLYHLIYQKVVVNIVEIKGWFKKTKYIVMIEAAINIVLSFILAKRFGVIGIVLATAVSTILTKFWYYPIYVYKNLFNKLPYKYYLNFFIDTIFSGILVTIYLKYFSNIYIGNYLQWIIFAIKCSVCVGTILLLYKYIFSKSFRVVVRKLYFVIKQKYTKVS